MVRSPTPTPSSQQTPHASTSQPSVNQPETSSNLSSPSLLAPSASQETLLTYTSPPDSDNVMVTSQDHTSQPVSITPPTVPSHNEVRDDDIKIEAEFWDWYLPNKQTSHKETTSDLPLPPPSSTPPPELLSPQTSKKVIHQQLQEEENNLVQQKTNEGKGETLTDAEENEEGEESEGYNEWWQKINTYNYCSNENLENLKILLPDDSPEFIERVVSNYIAQEVTKRMMDEKMQVYEEQEEPNQLSVERDKPLIEEFKIFVQNQATKDLLHLYSTDFDENRSGVKASTGGQYALRIEEFFDFMAKKYKGFHLDWFIDYQNNIMKDIGDAPTCEIFVPRKEDVFQFCEKFKGVGTNPAANIGLRINALKKFFSFLIKKYKDNEHLFPGNMAEKDALVEVLIKKVSYAQKEIYPPGTLKKISIASNRNHRKIMAQNLEKCPEKNVTALMDGVRKYINSDEYKYERNLLLELAYNDTKIPNKKEYNNSTGWILEMLVCIAGNRPCTILGLTVSDWENRKPGYNPHNYVENNQSFTESEEDPRRILKNPYSKPVGEQENQPTGIIVQSKDDKIQSLSVPCYLWFPEELAELVNAHSFMASKIIPSEAVDIYHPTTKLFLNSSGSPLTSIDCKHLKEFLGLPITSYDFRRSLVTYCMNSPDLKVRLSEPSVLRHSKETANSYYYQEHSQNVQFLSSKYARGKGLLRAEDGDVEKYLADLAEKGSHPWQVTQKRIEKQIEYDQELTASMKEKNQKAKSKSDRIWILQQEVDNFVGGIKAAIDKEKEFQAEHGKPGPFSELLKYQPGNKEGGIFPPNKYWYRTMCRVLFGLDGPEGDLMRQAELSVYDGIPFSNSGRKKIQAQLEKSPNSDIYSIVGSYWRLKMAQQNSGIVRRKLDDIEFIFNKADLKYYKMRMKRLEKMSE